MRVLVTGGTGTLGRSTVRALLDEGHQVAVLTRSAEGVMPDGVDRLVADLTTPETAYHDARGAESGTSTLLRACTERDVVLHLASAAGRNARSTDIDGTTRLAAAARRAGVGHVVLVSIVGCDRVPFGYYRAKTAAEAALRDSGAPWSVLRATQFHPFVAATLRRLPVADPGWRLQPVDVGVVADTLVDLAGRGPVGDVTVAGPQVQGVPELARAARAAGRRAPRMMVRIPGRLSATLREGRLTDPASARPGPSFADWLAAG